jgi:hypothetical protein
LNALILFLNTDVDFLEQVVQNSSDDVAKEATKILEILG